MNRTNRNRWISLTFACFILMISSGVAYCDPAKYLVLGNDRGHTAIVNNQGEVLWQYDNRYDGHDIWQLANKNILLATSPTTIAEVTPEKKIVWTYTSKPKEGYKGRIEVHSFQPLEDGRVLISETGNKRLIEVDREGKIAIEVPLTVNHPDPHRDTRLVRKLSTGNYLVCHEGDGVVREYDRTGKVVWSYTLDLAGRPRTGGHGPEGHGVEVFSAFRLPNGNTLIGGGNNNRVLEVNPAGKIVWSINHDDLPGIQLAWITQLHALPSGNVIIGNCHAGEKNPQLIEVNREKKIVWTFQNFKTFGNGLATMQILGLPEGAIR